MQFGKRRHPEFGALGVGDSFVDWRLNDVALILKHDRAVQLGTTGVERNLVAGFGMDEPGTLDASLVGFQRQPGNDGQVGGVTRSCEGSGRAPGVDTGHRVDQRMGPQLME